MTSVYRFNTRKYFRWAKFGELAPWFSLAPFIAFFSLTWIYGNCFTLVLLLNFYFVVSDILSCVDEIEIVNNERINHSYRLPDDPSPDSESKYPGAGV